MAYNYHTSGDVSSKIGGSDVRTSGTYIGKVWDTNDPLRMGRLGINIPGLTNTLTPDASQITWCQYLMPFYGAKNLNAISSTNPYDYKQNAQSYGMWMVPPDVGTDVLVMFAQGKTNEANAFWIGCIQQPQTNHQIPGLASSQQTSIKAEGGPAGGGETSKRADYGTDVVPAGEVNRAIFDQAVVGNYSTYKLPINEGLADQLKVQGLGQDTVRGTTTSSAQRESPSQVFGINTPGRIKPDSRSMPIGLEGEYISVDRDTGQSFVMDDGDEVGENQLIRLRSASGHQILLNDTEGVIYIANAKGNAWFEMDAEGRIDVYSEAGVSFRSRGDFNIHSDANINFHAKNDIRMSASERIIKSAKSLYNLGSEGVFTSSTNGSISDFANQGISSYTGGQQLHGAAGGTHLAGGQIHFNTIGASNSWGPHWLNKGAVGMIEKEVGDVDVEVTGTGLLTANSTTTKTTVHRLVTHEPMTRLKGFNSEGSQPWIDQSDNLT